MMKDAGKRHAMAAALKDTIAVKDSTLVVQYEIKASEGVSCDGAYIKLLQKEAVADLKKFDNTARYTIMFGPDKCGGNDKVHFILQHQNPVSKEWEEKHANDMPVSHLGDRKTHLYTLTSRPKKSQEYAQKVPYRDWQQVVHFHTSTVIRAFLQSLTHSHVYTK